MEKRFYNNHLVLLKLNDLISTEVALILKKTQKINTSSRTYIVFYLWLNVFNKMYQILGYELGEVILLTNLSR